MDPDVAQRFDTLESALIRLAEAQVKTDATVRELAAAQLRTETQVRDLAATQLRIEAQVHELAAAQLRTEARMTELTEKLGTLSDRVDRLAQLMIRGHTDAAERHAAVMDRIEKLQAT